MDQDRLSWEQKAEDWHKQVMYDGDKSRKYFSDPWIWKLLGNVKDKKILDLGCGTGYLSIRIASKGASVIGVDFAETMIQKAKQISPENLDIEFIRSESHKLSFIQNESLDFVVSNFVFMDIKEIEKTMDELYRVLNDRGKVITVFSHPCFPLDQCQETEEGVVFNWEHPYFSKRRVTSPPWAHHKSDFIHYHRPLSYYWQIFKKSGFSVLDFIEPVASEELKVQSPQLYENSLFKPVMVLFQLSKD